MRSDGEVCGAETKKVKKHMYAYNVYLKGFKIHNLVGEHVSMGQQMMCTCTSHALNTEYHMTLCKMSHDWIGTGTCIRGWSHDSVQ